MIFFYVFSRLCPYKLIFPPSKLNYRAFGTLEAEVDIEDKD